AGLFPGAGAPARPEGPQAIPARVEKALPLLGKGRAGHRAERPCFACHNQALPVLAFTTARTHGFKAGAADLDEDLEAIADFLDSNRRNLFKGPGQGGPAGTGGLPLL